MNWLTNIFGGLGQAAQGAGRSIAGAGNSLMGMFSGAGNTLAQGASQLGQGIGQNLAQNLGQTLGRTSQQAPAVSSPMGSSAQKLSLPSMGSAPMSPGLGMTGGATSPTESPIKKAQSNGWWNQLTQGINVPQTLLGMGVNAVGNMTAPKVNTPNIKDSANYQSMQNFNYQMPPGAEDMIKRSHEQVAEQERRNLRALYQNARPGADYLTDSAYIRDAANLDKALEQRLADELTKGGLQYAGTELGRQNDLIGYDQGQNMLQYGEDTQKADDYRKSFSNVGSMLTSSGLGDVMSGFNPTQDPLQLNPEESQNQQNSWQNIMQQFLKQMGA